MQEIPPDLQGLLEEDEKSAAEKMDEKEEERREGKGKEIDWLDREVGGSGDGVGSGRYFGGARRRF